MQLIDNTTEANATAEEGEAYLYHSTTGSGRWAIALEQTTATNYQVSVLFKAPDWAIGGVIRYWRFDDRALAEARYLELQTKLREIDEDLTIEAMLPKLPEPEQRA